MVLLFWYKNIIFQFSYIYHCHRQLVFAQFDNFLSILFLLFRQEFLRQQIFDLLMLSIMLSIIFHNCCSILFLVIEESFVVSGKPSICMSIRTRRFCASRFVCRLFFCRFVDVNSRRFVCRYVESYADSYIGFCDYSCRFCLLESELKKKAVTDEFERFSN